MRKLVAAVLLALMAACLWVAGTVLSHLFEDYKDMEDLGYVLVAAVPILVAVACLAGGILVLRRRSTQR